MPRNASTNSSHVSTDPYGNDSYHVAAISLKEKGKRCSFITSSLTPFSLTVFLFFPLNALFFAIDIAAWQSQCIDTEGVGCIPKEISDRKFFNHSASLPVDSRAINS